MDPSLNIVVDSSQLPAQHGTDVKYSCPQNSDILDGNVKAVCTDGKISLSPENVSPCKETSMLMMIFRLAGLNVSPSSFTAVA